MHSPEPSSCSLSDPVGCPHLPGSYRHMSGEEIQLDRYAKFRKLGQFQEFAVRGGDWRNAIAERSAVSPCGSVCARVCVGWGGEGDGR